LSLSHDKLLVKIAGDRYQWIVAFLYNSIVDNMPSILKGQFLDRRCSCYLLMTYVFGVLNVVCKCMLQQYNLSETQHSDLSTANQRLVSWADIMRQL